MANAEQAELWSTSPSAGKWLTYEDEMDALLAPVLTLVLDRAGLRAGLRVLDIGCGTGASCVAAAQRVGPAGHVLAVDFSQQFLDRARQRASDAGLSNVAFQYADAQTFPFVDGAQDALISRFGVMFFDDPVAAFANMARALKPGGQLTFAAWGPLDDNPWFKLPHIEATKQLGSLPKFDRNAPGPLAFHDRDRVIGILSQAGLTDIQAEAVPLFLKVAGTLQDCAALCTRIGPAARLITHFEATSEDIDIIRKAVAKVFQPFERADGVHIPAVINLFQARCSK